MLTAELRVKYEGDWTAELAKYDAFGEFLASTFRNREYIGIIALETSDLDASIEVIRDHQMTETVDVVERYSPEPGDRMAATLFIRGQLTEFTPLQTLMYEGYLPIGPTTLEDGRECFDLLLSDREELSKAVEMLRDFGTVQVERISQDFSRQVLPSAAGWQELLSSFPPRQRQILKVAYERGYYEIPRETTLEEIADEIGITKTTASNHLRKAERRVIEFLVTYLNLAATDT
ncbi:helix-turn-helix domain-containing protein [Natronolimnohabitans sp. A-GB9]|uniref:helix-turn-helix domain-containing protein n=1 Tax=Natronolimnohabitans sp. A-GB9 TaxID=3069757 RepID=UPI0027B2C6C3|nr:helix-turn-helix domain-containing protein [Natronolimnohabitans sp. A-GB9]MDQ2052222.1 helix-turn-helix domain-containing protein [Natronolimnohabitans sp. A-GB9]